MALLHHADLVPSKLELVAGWAPSQPWFDGDAGVALTNVGAFRFDDPAGEVGVETVLVRAGGGAVMQVPLTYRSEAVFGAEQFLIGTLEHSVLGTRWVYDAAGDPVYLEELARAALTGGTQVEQYFQSDGEKETKTPTALVTGSGEAGASVPSAHDDHVPATRDDRSSTLVETDHLALLIARTPLAHPLASDTGAHTLGGTWLDQVDAAILALVSVRG